MKNLISVVVGYVYSGLIVIATALIFLSLAFTIFGLIEPEILSSQLYAGMMYVFSLVFVMIAVSHVVETVILQTESFFTHWILLVCVMGLMLGMAASELGVQQSIPGAVAVAVALVGTFFFGVLAVDISD